MEQEQGSQNVVEQLEELVNAGPRPGARERAAPLAAG